MPNPKCERCGKTVYPMEAVGVFSKTWHKGCFKCSEEGCSVSLSLNSVRYANERIWCTQHEPKEKPNVTNDSMQLTNARDAPKIDTVNEQQRSMGVDRKGSQQLSFSQSAQKNAPKVEVVSNETRRMEGADRKGTQSLGFAETNAQNAPKLSTVSNETRVMDGADRRGTQAAVYRS